MSNRNSVDEIPHVLVIEEKCDDPIDTVWHVRHLDSCPKEQFLGWFDKHEPMQYFTCRVQACIDGNGLDDIENWKDLPVGEHLIVSQYVYYPGDFGGSYGAEHEISLMLKEADDE